MEASAADAGQATDAQAEGQEQQEEGQEQQAPQIPEEITNRLDQLSQQITPLAEDFQQRSQQEPEPEGEPEGQQDQGFLYTQEGLPVDPQTGQIVDPDVAAQREMEQHMQGYVKDAVTEALAPWMEQQQQDRVVQEAERLETEIPALKDPEAAEAAVNQARQLANEIGQPELAGDPKFVRLTYLAGQAEQLAQGETPAGDTQEAVQIEGGGGSTPAASEEDQTGMNIVRAGRPQGQALGGLY